MDRSHLHRNNAAPLPVRLTAMDWDLTSRPPTQDVANFNCAWGVTMPADLVALPQPTPFHETILGLVTREVTEPDVFAHFFGE